MARWRLAAPHYLNTGDTEWEYSEIDRTSGRPKRVKFAVPRLINPEDPSDWNYVYSKDGFGKPDSGECIVAQGEHEPKDIVFIGDPTPDMVPLDDEAKAISAKHASKWKHPIESLSGTYADEMLKDLSKEMDEVRTKSTSAQVEGMSELLTAMTAMMKQNQDMMAAIIASRSAEPEPKAARRA